MDSSATCPGNDGFSNDYSTVGSADNFDPENTPIQSAGWKASAQVTQMASPPSTVIAYVAAPKPML
ncbi:hypothetical protein I314_06333 [Cryptococcus bacillisporus CA1873]|uniref:Uncharacterized protein n=1 Tax=Cryptococcus bacillisporus CA1873 TaxID=1296111 RepID=A0ABR5B378_CRYGA|nr:hypothetical protein I314_06333 [Cryptococcus bacillisporus CA1873]|eukprot:KIR57829.1 hypothetical protein I314_06333 [Cryptococcus gattii CA1873]